MVSCRQPQYTREGELRLENNTKKLKENSEVVFLIEKLTKAAFTPIPSGQMHVSGARIYEQEQKVLGATLP